MKLPSTLTPNQVLWLSVIALAIVLAVTWMLVPKATAPFIYTFF